LHEAVRGTCPAHGWGKLTDNDLDQAEERHTTVTRQLAD
jgi:hypothetical protein